MFAARACSYLLFGLLTAQPLSAALVYSTYVGGAGNDHFNGIAVDSSGNAYMTGDTTSTDFPTAGVPFQPINNGGTDAVVTKLNATGSALIYSTYLGGAGTDTGFGIAVDGSGNAYVTGVTDSSGVYPTGFPTTVTAFQAANAGGQDAFVTKLSANGTVLLYSTYLGGTGQDQGNGIALNATIGTVYVAGTTASSDFPTTGGVAQATFGGGSSDAFVAELNPAAIGPLSLIYATYLGGTDADFGNAIALDSAGDAYAAGSTESTDFPTVGPYQGANAGGSDAFVTKLSPAGTAFIYSTYLGGSIDDFAFGIAVDSFGDAYLAGLTFSGDFPTTAGAFQTSVTANNAAFVTKFNSSGNDLVYSTFLSGTGGANAQAIAVDSLGNAFVTGGTFSTDFPVTPGAIPGNGDGSGSAAFFSRFNNTGSALLYSTLLGGQNDQGNGIAVDSAAAYIAGFASIEFPTTANAFQQTFAGGGSDGFSVKFSSIFSAPVNHILLYNVAEQSGPPNPHPPVAITLQDRFLTQSVHVQQPVAFGNPVDKTFNDIDSPIVLDFLHYTAYFINEPCPSGHGITAVDQFGSLTVSLRGGHVLLAPTWEIALNVTPPTPLPDDTHFRCYDVFASGNQNRGVIDDGQFIAPLAVMLTDSFTNTSFSSLVSSKGYKAATTPSHMKVVAPKKYCVAAIKTHNGVVYPADIVSTTNNYMCYELFTPSPPTPVTDITTLDQFGRNIFKTTGGMLLCVPSTITSTP